MGKYADAATTFEQLLARYPDTKSVERLVLLADLHRRAGHDEAAVSVLREAMRLDPGDGQAQYNLAVVLSDVGQVDDAVRVLREAARRDPRDHRYDLRQGYILTRFHRNEEAIKLFESMLKRFADQEEIVKEVRPLLSMVYVNQGDYVKGEAELEKVLERFPDDSGRKQRPGLSLCRAGQEPREGRGDDSQGFAGR